MSARIDGYRIAIQMLQGALEVAVHEDLPIGARVAWRDPERGELAGEVVGYAADVRGRITGILVRVVGAGLLDVPLDFAPRVLVH